MNKRKKILNVIGFTLIEVMLGITIVSIVLVSGFKAFSVISIGKVQLIQEVNMKKESFYFIEKLNQIIKQGGTLDYEEYFNRKMIGDTQYSSGHFVTKSGFGNYGQGGILGTSTYGNDFYLCRSGKNNTNKLNNNGCYDNNLNNNTDSYIGDHHRYGQYSYQFVDYNANIDNDGLLIGDEDGDGNIVGDDDDEYTGLGPIVFTENIDLKSLFLVSGDGKAKIRRYFRWKVLKDPNAIAGKTCSIDSTNVILGDGCIGTIEMLVLEGKDWGLDHNINIQDEMQSDGLIDTWIIDSNLTGSDVIIAGSVDMDKYRIPMFSNSINIFNFEVFSYPNVQNNYIWKENTLNSDISPYTILKISIKPSWLTRKKLKNRSKEFVFSLTVNLSNIYNNN